MQDRYKDQMEPLDLLVQLVLMEAREQQVPPVQQVLLEPQEAMDQLGQQALLVRPEQMVAMVQLGQLAQLVLMELRELQVLPVQQDLPALRALMEPQLLFRVL